MAVKTFFPPPAIAYVDGEFRFDIGSQRQKAAIQAVRNSGVMIHGQTPESIGLDPPRSMRLANGA